MAKNRRNRNRKGRRQESPPELVVPSQSLEETQADTEPDLENESNTEEPQRTSLEENYDRNERIKQHQSDVEPHGDHRDIIAFIGNWMVYSILLVFLVLYIAVVSSALGYSFNYETLWHYLFLLFLIFFPVTASVCLAIWANFSDFFRFVFKWASFINIFIIAIFTGVIISISYFHVASFNGEFWIVVPWVFIVWWTALVNTWIAWFSIKNRDKLKVNLFDFLHFVTRYVSVFCLLLAVLSLAMFTRTNTLGILDGGFWILMEYLILFLVFASLSGVMALFLEKFRWRNYSTGRITWRNFRHIIFRTRI